MHLHFKAQFTPRNFGMNCHAIFMLACLKQTKFGIILAAKTDNARCACLGCRAGKLVIKRIVNIQDGCAASLQALENFGLGFGDIIKAVKKAAMRAGNPRNQGNVGARQCGQGGNFTSSIHAHFLNGKIAICCKSGKGDWHADMVVKAALASMGFAKSGKSMLQHIFAAGFADRTRDANHFAGKAVSASPPKTRQRVKRIIDNDLRNRGIRVWTANKTSRRASIGGLGNEIMPILLVTNKRDKQITRFAMTAINFNA